MGVITNLSLGAGTINYVSADGGAESGTGTWVTYNDGASSTPLDAVGGLASLVTLTTDNVTPLRGSQSLVLNKLAGNAQGQGISIPFTIDTADLAKPLHISFDYAVTSATGTYADGRLQVYLLETHFSDLVTTGTVLDTAPPSGSNTVITSLGSTTNLYIGWRVSGVGVPAGTTVVSVGVGTVTVSKAITIGAGITFTFSPPIIQPAGYTVMAGAQGIQLKHSGCTFQTSPTIKNYQLCIHVASTDTTAYSLELDNVEVGPERAAYGVPVTDWVSYTPTFNSGFSVGTGGLATNNWKYRRVGDSIEIKGRVLFGTVGNSMGAGNFTVSIPSGLSIDVNKLDTVASLNSYGSAGVAWIYDSGGTSQREVYFANRSDTSLTSVQVEGRTDAGVGSAWNSAFPITWGSSDSFMLIFTLPIQGWSSNTVMSSDTDTRVVAVNGYLASGLSIPHNTFVPIDFSTSQDTHAKWIAGSGYDSVTGLWGGAGNPTRPRYVIPVSGTYRISANIAYDNFNSTEESSIGLWINNVQYDSVIFTGIGAGAFWAGTGGSIEIPLSAGSVVDIRAFQFSGVSKSITGGRCNFAISRLSGPATIAASESVQAKFYASVGGTCNTTTPINFDSKVYDSHGAVTTGASWKFTAPISGKYLVTTFINSSVVPAGNVYLRIYTNGGAPESFSYILTTQGTASASEIMSLNAGDYIDIRTNANFPWYGSSITNSASLISIARIGN